jgi:hypothetical protein
MSLERRSDMANKNIDDDTRKRALAFVEKNKKGAVKALTHESIVQIPTAK